MPAPARRELIVAAALREFAERGYEGASMGRIAAAAGVTRTVLYDHFPSKEALFASLLERESGALVEHMRQTLTGQGTMRERMRATFEAFFAFAQEHPTAWRLLFPENPPLDGTVAEAHRRVRADSNRALARLLVQDARRAGIDPDSAVGRMVFTIHQEALHGLARWWHEHPDVPREQVVEATMVALWTGLGAAER
jgi:AcrR family transcriptional regulator